MNPADQKRLVEATKYAYAWHSGQRRKATNIPYVSHLLQVKGLVIEHGGQADQAIAGLLHDSLEDAQSASDRAHREQVILEKFGESVLRMVSDCTDTLADEFLAEKRPWKERKDRYIAHLDEAGADSLLVVACDKRHNLHAIVWDIRSQGLAIFDRLTGTPEQQVWYFESVLAKIENAIPQRLRQELEDLLESLKELIGNKGQ